MLGCSAGFTFGIKEKEGKKYASKRYDIFAKKIIKRGKKR